MIASSTCWITGRTEVGLGRVRRGDAGPADPGEREQVCSLGFVELQGVRDPVEDGVRGTGEVAALHPDVVIDADPREERDLFATQPLHPAVATVTGRRPGPE